MYLTSLLPVFNEDIFLKYRPFPEKPTNIFEAHWHEVIGSFLMYTGIQLLSYPICRRLFGTKYSLLDKKTRINFDIHVVSMFQAVISILSIIPMWNHPLLSDSRLDPSLSVTGYYPYGGFVGSSTTGYFLWDFVMCAVCYKLFGLGFLAHAVAALTVFLFSFIPFNIPWIPAFLLFELSTPFVNINWFASKLPSNFFSENVVIVNGLMLIGTFFWVRIVWSLSAFYTLFKCMLVLWAETESYTYKACIVTTTVMKLLLDSLNIFWLYKMISIARKKLNNRTSYKQAENELSKKVI